MTNDILNMAAALCDLWQASVFFCPVNPIIINILPFVEENLNIHLSSWLIYWNPVIMIFVSVGWGYMKDLGIREIDQGGTFLRILKSDGEEMKNKTKKSYDDIPRRFLQIYIYSSKLKSIHTLSKKKGGGGLLEFKYMYRL